MQSLNKFYQNLAVGAVGMGLIWALGWGLGAGGFMEAFVDPRGEILDMWPQTLGIPGFLGGVIFYVVLRIAEGRHKFDELPLTRISIWGVVSGLLLFGFMLAIFQELWREAIQFIGIAILLSVIAAVVSAILFRYAVWKQHASGAAPEK